MGDLGLFGLPFPEAIGGMGGDYFALAITLEELARVDSSVAITLEAGISLGAMPIFRFGTEAQREQWLPDLITGRALGAFGLTEPGGGSDAGATRTVATLADDGWTINGSKAFITNSGTSITALITVTAVTGTREDGRKQISRDLGAGRHGGSHRRSAVLEGRLELFGHPRSVVRRVARYRRRICWVREDAATRSSSRFWTRAGSLSPRSRSDSRRAASTNASDTSANAKLSAPRSALTRLFSSRSPTWRCAHTPPDWRITTQPNSCWPARLSRRRPR